MVGRSVDQLFPRVPHAVGEPVLTLRGITGITRPRARRSGSASRGDLGDCRTGGCWPHRIAAMCLRPRGRANGEIRVAGNLCRPSPRRCIRAGLGMVSEDRKGRRTRAAALDRDNLTLSHLGPYSRLGWLNRRMRQKATEQWLATLAIRAAGCRSAGPRAVGGQPAESGSGPRPASGCGHLVAGRADPRHRRGHQGRHLSADRPMCRGRQGHDLSSVPTCRSCWRFAIVLP